MQCVERMHGGDIEEKSTIESIAAVCRMKKKEQARRTAMDRSNIDNS